MRTAELVGYLASALVFATFYMKTLTPMRAAAIASNVAFICYGYLGEMIPILILHSLLLPLNVWRFLQVWPLGKEVWPAAKGDLRLDRLLPDAAFRRFAAGETIFRKGEPARELFLVTAGRVQLTELEVEAEDGRNCLRDRRSLAVQGPHRHGDRAYERRRTGDRRGPHHRALQC